VLDFEPFVDAHRAAEFLSLRPRRILELARAAQIPGHPVGAGKRKQWRFRLSELAAAVASGPRKPPASREGRALADDSARRTIPVGSPRSQWRKSNG
jgi:hypothetical protein